MTDFWDNLLKEAAFDNEASRSIDDFLGEGTPFESEQFTSMRELTDRSRQANALSLPVEAGTRVEFAGKLGAVLAYEDSPDPKAQGTVVAVKSAGGDLTAHEGKVFVEWDDGKFRSIHAEHLRMAPKGRTKKQAVNQMRVANLGDLTDFLKVAEGTLIHKSTQDLWSFRQDGGEYVIERLFDDNGGPLKG